MSARRLLSMVALLVLPGLFLTPPLRGADSAVGLQGEVKIQDPTRLDWQFVASGFGPAARLPEGYDSRHQRFQLFVPKNYTPAKRWPLVVFVSPGDDPLGWRYWQKPCEQAGVLFCAPYAAGNNCPPGKRVRIVLDMFDQVRRQYRIDPEQTYVSGFSGGGRIACTIGFNLPEYFAGVIPICGTNPLPSLTYLRHRVQARQAVAFVTGAQDFNRAENEQYMAPYFKELGIHSKLWVVPELGHGIPDAAVLGAVLTWLRADVERRRQDTRTHLSLAIPPEDGLTPERLAARLLDAAETALKDDKQLWRGVALLQGIRARWEKTAAGEKANKLLKGLLEDERKARLIEEQGGVDERLSLFAQAQALDRFGQHAAALQGYRLLVEQHPFSPEGRQAAQEVRRLTQVLQNTPFLGVGFKGTSNSVSQIGPESPAARGGLKAGDQIIQVEQTRVRNAEAVKLAISKYKPGQKITLQIERDRKKLALTVQLGGIPVEK